MTSSYLLAVALAFSSWSTMGDPEKVRPGTAPPDPNATVVAQGVLDRELVRRYVQLHRPAVRHCYQLELGKQPGLTTSVSVTFTIGPDGRVSSLGQAATALARCVGQAVRAIRFPELSDLMSDGSTRPSQSSTSVTYRFAFKPARRDAHGKALPPEEADSTPAGPEADGPRAPAVPPAPAASPPASAPAASPPASAPAPSRARPRRRGKDRSIDTRHGDDPLRGIPSGDTL